MKKAKRKVNGAAMPGAVKLWEMEMRDPTKLRPHPKNPRAHSDAQIDGIGGSMEEFGITSVLVVDEKNQILAGHARTTAAGRKKVATVPTFVVRGWSEEKKLAFMIADNQWALLATWNQELIRADVQSLKFAGYDTKLLGFDNATLSWMSTGDSVNDPSAEWAGMPQFEQRDKTAFRSLIVHFKDQQAVDSFAKAIKQKIGPAIRSIWHPEAEIETYADKRYVAGTPK